MKNFKAIGVHIAKMDSLSEFVPLCSALNCVSSAQLKSSHRPIKFSNSSVQGLPGRDNSLNFCLPNLQRGCSKFLATRDFDAVSLFLMIE